MFHGMKSYFCQNEEGQVDRCIHLSAGLDYPGIGPEHAYLRDLARQYVPITDEGGGRFQYLSHMEGIIPAIGQLMHGGVCHRWLRRWRVRLLSVCRGAAIRMWPLLPAIRE